MAQSGRQTHHWEDRAIQQLCEQLERREGVPVRPEDRPDQRVSDTSACDAIIRRGNERWAVEHTRAMYRPREIELNRRLESVRDPIKQLIGRASAGHSIVIGIPKDSLPSNHRLREIAAAKIAEEALAAIPQMSEGNGRWVRSEVLASRFLLQLRKPGSRRGSSCAVLGILPKDHEKLETDEMCRALMHKKDLLDKFRSNGFRTLLILDAVGTWWHASLYSAFVRSTELVSLVHLDEVYLAVSGGEPIRFVPLKIGGLCPVGQPQYAEFVDLWEDSRASRGLHAGGEAPSWDRASRG